jgi:hypothetical protein
MNLRLHILTLLISFLTFYQANGQSYEIRNIELEKSKSYGAYVIGIDEKGYVYTEGVRQFLSFRTYWLKVYDPGLGKMIAEKSTKFKTLDDLGYRYLYFRFIDHKPILVVRSKDITDKQYYAFDIDHNLNILGGAYPIGNQAQCGGLLVGGTGKGIGRDLKISKASDRSITFLSDLTCSRDKALTFQLKVLNEYGNELFSSEVEFEDLNPIKKSELVALSERQSFFYIEYDRVEKVEGKLFRQQMTYQRLFAISSFGDVVEIDLELNEAESISSFQMIASGDELLVTGLLAEGDRDHFIGVFSGKIDPATNTFKSMKTNYFTEEFATQYWTKFEKERIKRKEKKPSLGSGFKLLDHFTTADSGAVYFAQKYELKEVTQTTSSPTTGGRLSTDYHHYYTDLVVIKINKEGELSWNALIPIEQHTINYDPGVGFVAASNNNEIIVMHLSSTIKEEEINKGEVITERRRIRDRIKNEVAITRISINGVLSTKNVINLREEKMSFDPSAVSVDQEKKVFIFINTPTSIFKRKRTQLKVVDFSRF